MASRLIFIIYILSTEVLYIIQRENTEKYFNVIFTYMVVKNIKDTFVFLQIPITLHKETEVNENGEEVMKCGFKIGGGIDQDFRKSPQGYTDNVL